MTNFLSMDISSFCEESSNVNYLFPTSNNLEPGKYASEIVDVQEVVTLDGSLGALDFYHRLTDSSGNVTYVRFRYYEKELPALAKALKQYASIKIFGDAIGLNEDVEITPKKTGKYMQIAVRKVSNVANEGTSSSTSASSTMSSHVKRGGLAGRLNKKPQQPSKRVLSSEFEEDEFDLNELLQEDED